jgi:hypothetical protein
MRKELIIFLKVITGAKLVQGNQGTFPLLLTGWPASSGRDSIRRLIFREILYFCPVAGDSRIFAQTTRQKATTPTTRVLTALQNSRIPSGDSVCG